MAMRAFSIPPRITTFLNCLCRCIFWNCMGKSSECVGGLVVLAGVDLPRDCLHAWYLYRYLCDFIIYIAFLHEISTKSNLLWMVQQCVSIFISRVSDGDRRQCSRHSIAYMHKYAYLDMVQNLFTSLRGLISQKLCDNFYTHKPLSICTKKDDEIPRHCVV